MRAGEPGRPPLRLLLILPLALACIDKTSNTLSAVQHTGGFTANILATGRDQLARHMATKVTGKVTSISGVKVGDFVSASISGANGKLTADSIQDPASLPSGSGQ